MRMKTVSLLFVFLMVSFVKLFSQETTSEISGVVRGEGKGLEGATVEAIHLPTGTRYATMTRQEGRYNLANLKVGGPYEIKVTFVGFKAGSANNIMLLLGQ